MHPDLVRAVTDLGDLGVVLPTAAVLIIVLWRAESGRTAAMFGLVLGVCLATMLALKLAFAVCGEHWQLGVRSPSGHAGMSSLVYGSFAAVCATHAGPRRGSLAVAAMAALILAIAVTRVVGGYHTALEVAIGLAVGTSALAAFAVWYGRQPHPPLNLRGLAALVAVGLVVAYGSHVPGERMVSSLAGALRLPWAICGAAP